MRNEVDLKMTAQSMDQGFLRLHIQGCACKPVAAGEWQRDDQVDQRLAQSDQATSKRHPGPNQTFSVQHWRPGVPISESASANRSGMRL